MCGKALSLQLLIQRFNICIQWVLVERMEGVSLNGEEVDLHGVENAEENRPGGYHPLTPGDVLGGR